MKVTSVFVLVAALLVVVQAFTLDPVDEEPSGVPQGDRHKRVTCDLLSASTPWGSVNHAACAARCLLQGKKGGRCVDAVCNCRN